jgi:osmotically inducible protein OsmC
MITRTATARYEGTGKHGKGWVSTQSGVLSDQRYGFNTRFENEPGTNPEELIAAAHSACFSMAFSNALGQNGTPPESLQVTAAVTFVPGEGITGSHLLVSAKIPGLSEEDFQRLAEDAKANCPVSKLLNAEMSLTVTVG